MSNIALEIVVSFDPDQYAILSQWQCEFPNATY